MQKQNDFEAVKIILMEVLSPFEKDVLEDYLKCKSIKNIVKYVEKRLRKTKYKQVAIDNALYRIHRKAQKLKMDGKLLNFPSFNV